MSVFVSDVSQVSLPVGPIHATDAMVYPALAAHRGGKLINPEASMKAFRDIRDNYPDMLIEMDVHKLKTGELVIWHDKTALGKPIYELTADQWRKVRIPDQDGGTQPAPHLHEVLDEFGSTGTTMLIELKAEHAQQDFIQAIWPHRFNIITQCFNAKVSSVFIRSGLHTLQLSSSYQPPILDGAYGIGVRYDLITEQTMSRARAAGQKVWAWTVDTQHEIDELIELGVDGIMTDDPRLTVT